MGDLAMYRGDDRQLVITASETMTGSVVRFTAKYARADELAAIEKSSDAGGIEIDDTVATVSIDAADTDSIATPKTLRWDVEVTDAFGSVRTVATGRLIINTDVTR